MGSAPQDKETPEVDEKSRETALGHILLESTDKEYASETHSSLISGAELCPQPEINPVPMVDGHELTLILEHFSNAQSSGYTFYRVVFENSSWLTGSSQEWN